MTDKIPNKKHTLENIIDALGKNFDEDKVHTALFLAYAQAIYSVVSRLAIPSPMYRITYKPSENRVDLSEPQGFALVPKENTLDINVLDGIFISNLRDIPLLLEGETGTGKTYASQVYLSTVLMRGNYFSYRLSANAFMNNLFSHFQEGKMCNGMPVIVAREDLIETTAGGITDEINRGDSNETLQLLDNEMHLKGLIYKLGIPIPVIKDKKYLPRDGKIKKMLLIAAQNPAAEDDAKFTQTVQLDAAVDNRLLKAYIGNSAQSAGSTIWLGEQIKDPHETFWSKLSATASKYLGTEISIPIEDRLSTYAWITDSSRTDKPILYSAMELSDFMIGTFGGNVIKYYDQEREIIKSWGEILKKDIEIKEPLKETNTVKDINKVVESFNVPIILRDTAQMKKIADVLSTLANIKDALSSKDPVNTYLNTKRYVTVKEVAGATAILARNKQKRSSESPIKSINQVLNEYISLVEEYTKDSKMVVSSFDMFDSDIGIKRVAIYQSIRDTMRSTRSANCLIDNLADKVEGLISKISASADIKNVLIARSAGDIMTLCGFVNQYKDKINIIMRSYDSKTDPTKVINDLAQVYYKELSENGVVVPEIYQHRILRTLGE